MNNERINNLLTIAKRLDTETKNRSITISTEEMIDLLESYKELKNQISDLIKLLKLMPSNTFGMKQVFNHTVSSLGEIR